MSQRIHRGIVVPGRGLGAKAMSALEMTEAVRQILGFDFVPGTLNVRLPDALDADLGSYVAWEDLGRQIPDPEVPNRRGLRYGRVIIAGRFQGVAFQGDEPDYPSDLVELVSDHHLRTTLGLSDGDPIEFRLIV